MANKKTPVKWPEPEYGLDNTYCFKERVDWITETLRRRYGDLVKATPLRLELNMNKSEFSSFCGRSGLYRKTVCMGTYRVEDVAYAVAGNL